MLHRPLHASSLMKALDKSQAIIEFTLDGNIVNANENFLSTMGYLLEEIKGKHHRIFVDPAYANSAKYRQFWERLRSGEYFSAEFQRFGKGNREVWIQASYNPVMDAFNRPTRIVKLASDITHEKLRSTQDAGQIAAMDKSHAVIEFAMDGTILDANENFLSTMGYSLEEIRGHHHRMFVDDAYANTTEYAAFWETLRRGQHMAAEYQRFGKHHKEVWIQASYNPILDTGWQAV